LSRSGSDVAVLTPDLAANGAGGSSASGFERAMPLPSSSSTTTPCSPPDPRAWTVTRLRVNAASSGGRGGTSRPSR
jgi:hypothetical protein